MKAWLKEILGEPTDEDFALEEKIRAAVEAEGTAADEIEREIAGLEIVRLVRTRTHQQAMRIECARQEKRRREELE